MAVKERPPTAAAPGRRAAYEALLDWSRLGRHADETLADALAEGVEDSRDRAFARELFFGVLRNQRALDFWIAHLVQRPPEDGPRRILQLGLYQLLILHTPAHAALHDTVELAHLRKRSFINGVLRQANRQAARLQEMLSLQPPPVRYSHPDFLYDRWSDHFGREATMKLLEWDNLPAPIYVRLQGDEAHIHHLLEKFPDLTPTRHSRVFQTATIPAGLLEGADAYVQDPSTLPVCEALQPQPGERILDACAAPGGKSLYLAHLAGDRAEVLAADSAGARIVRLRRNIERLQARSISIRQIDWEREIPDDLGLFDKILLDAPCSNTGVLRRRVDARWQLGPDSFRRWAGRQLGLLEAVAPLLKPGGRLAYSTCSLDREENQEVVQEFLAGSEGRFELESERVIRPDLDGMDGAYYAILRR